MLRSEVFRLIGCLALSPDVTMPTIFNNTNNKNNSSNRTLKYTVFVCKGNINNKSINVGNNQSQLSVMKHLHITFIGQISQS